MKTSQQMLVKIGEYGDIIIGHKTRFGRASDIMSMGNLLREQRGLRPFEISEILHKKDFWEFAIAQNANIIAKEKHSIQSLESKVWIEPNFELLDNYKNTSGQLDYAKLIKEMPAVIKSQRGGKVENRGVWMELALLLKLAAYLDKVLEVEIYDCFITGNLLTIRDTGGNNFIKLNTAIDKVLLTPLKLSNCQKKTIYQDVAMAVRVACGLPKWIPVDVNVWNDLASQEQLHQRSAILNKLEGFLDNKLVKDVNQLLELIENIQ